jgi:4'-phosphopantetheinyl transferase
MLSPAERALCADQPGGDPSAAGRGGPPGLPRVGWWLTPGPPPAGSGWLGPWERSFEERLRIVPRLHSWRLGRWAAHQTLVARFPALGPAELDVRQAPGGEPWAFAGGARRGCSLSLSHRDGQALCAVGPADLRLGCDLERIEPRSPAFVADYFTAAEQAFIMATGDAPRFANLLWSAKESALKALGTGLRRDTRSVEVVLDGTAAAVTLEGGGWTELAVRDVTGGGVLRGRARCQGEMIITLVADREHALEPLQPGP